MFWINKFNKFNKFNKVFWVKPTKQYLCEVYFSDGIKTKVVITSHKQFIQAVANYHNSLIGYDVDGVFYSKDAVVKIVECVGQAN